MQVLMIKVSLYYVTVLVTNDDRLPASNTLSDDVDKLIVFDRLRQWHENIDNFLAHKM